MLTALSIRNFALIDELDLEFDRGLSVFTGETGAGKSILIDALQLALGERASATTVRQRRCEISAEFDLADRADLGRWLAERDLDADGELLLRRVVTAEGRSRAYINGAPVPVQKLRRLGSMLVEVHGQHEHQALVRPAEQLRLLDAYLARPEELAALGAVFEAWKTAGAKLEGLRARAGLDPAELDLLRYQVEELERCAVPADELERLNDEQRRLAGMGDLIAAVGESLELTEGEDDPDNGACARIAAAIRRLESAARLDPKLAEPLELLQAAQIQAQEAAAALNRYRQGLELDPQRLSQVEEQLADIYRLARKHRVEPQELTGQLATLGERLTDALEFEQRDEQYRAELEALETDYRRQAAALSRARQTGGARLSKEVTGLMDQLGMRGGRFEVTLAHDPDGVPRRSGLDEIGFKVTANPGTAPAPLGQIASGGELSRICLALKVTLSEVDRPVTMIFDEVDAGVGGATAQIVGEKLRAVAAATQVFCVTHLPQVAACAQAHFRVEKKKSKGETTTGATRLDDGERVAELARMLGGVKITEQTRAHAAEMLRGAAG